MGFYQYFIFISLIILTVVVILLSRSLKKSVTAMHGMTIIMFYSMNVGLTIGTLLGGSFQGNLYYSTIISILLGLFIGLISGSYFGLLAVIEGVMSGIMGGMMGAMLGEMVSQEQMIPLVRIFLLFSISTIFLLVIFSKRSDKSNKINKLWIIKPLIIGTLITFYFVEGVPFAEKQIIFQSKDSKIHHPVEHTTKKQDPTVITIETQNMQYTPSNISLQKNQPVTIIFKNHDNIDHNIEVEIPTINRYQGTNHHNHGKSENVIFLHSEPKHEQMISFTPTNAGVYEFTCKVPGHKESGMVGWITVR